MTTIDLAADAVKAERHRRNLSLDAMAALVGCDRQTYWRWEAGTRTPTGMYAVRLRDLMADPFPPTPVTPGDTGLRLFDDAWQPADDAVYVRTERAGAGYLTADDAWRPESVGPGFPVVVGLIDRVARLPEETGALWCVVESLSDDDARALIVAAARCGYDIRLES